MQQSDVFLRGLDANRGARAAASHLIGLSFALPQAGCDSAPCIEHN